MYIRITQDTIETPCLSADEGMLEPMTHKVAKGDVSALVCHVGKLHEFPYVIQVVESLLKKPVEFATLDNEVEGLWMAAFSDGRLLVGSDRGVIPLQPAELPLTMCPLDIPIDEIPSRPLRTFPLPPKVKLRLATTGGVN